MKKPTPAGLVTQILQSPFNEGDLILMAKGFLESSPKGALRIALSIIGFKPSSVEAWIILFKSAVAIQQARKTYFWTKFVESLIARSKRIHNLRDGAEILAAHPTCISLWSQVLDIVINIKDNHFEELIRRIILECDMNNTRSMADLGDFLCRKAQLLADSPKIKVCFGEAIALLERARTIHKDDPVLAKKLTNIYALSATHGWQQIAESEKRYRGLTTPE